MTLISDIWLIATTRAGVPKANSGSKVMEFEINSQGQVVKLPMGNPPGDTFEPNRADIFHFDLSAANIDENSLRPGEMRITNPSGDGWLPASFWVIGKNKIGQFKLLLANPNWPIKWFDSNGGTNDPWAPTWPLNSN